MSKVINCAFAGLSPHLVQAAQLGVDGIADAITHPYQQMVWEGNAIKVNAIKFDPKSFPDLPAKITLGGVPIVLDAALPETVIHFRDKDGNILSTLENLAIPCLS